jgi:bifunctional DNase/RNase
VETEEADMTEVKVLDIIKAEEGDAYCVCLNDQRGRVLTIFIGPSEAVGMAVAKARKDTPRPLTYKTVANLVEALGAGIERIIIEAIKDSVFYANIYLRAKEGSAVVDARPSDAIALALSSGTPIFVADDVMDKFARTFPKDTPEPTKKLRGTDEIVAELEGKFAHAMKISPAEDESKKKAFEAAFNYHIGKLLERVGNDKSK